MFIVKDYFSHFYWLQKEEKYADIHYGIKLCAKNIGFNGKFYTFPYFCTFMLKRYMLDKITSEKK